MGVTSNGLRYSDGLQSWEPVLTHMNALFMDANDDLPSTISEIWAIEPVHHGDAAMLNKEADLIGMHDS